MAGDNKHKPATVDPQNYIKKDNLRFYWKKIRHFIIFCITLTESTCGFMYPFESKSNACMWGRAVDKFTREYFLALCKASAANPCQSERSTSL